VEAEVEVAVGTGVGTVVPYGLILASVGLVHPEESTQTMRKNVAKRKRILFMKISLIFYHF
jgi:hypothetical protein